MAEQVPWWWPPEVLRERRSAVSGIGLGAVNNWSRTDMPSMWVVPPANNLLGIETVRACVVMSVCVCSAREEQGVSVRLSLWV